MMEFQLGVEESCPSQGVLQNGLIVCRF